MTKHKRKIVDGISLTTSVVRAYVWREAVRAYLTNPNELIQEVTEYPPADRWLNYEGALSDGVIGDLLGPTIDGRPMTVVEAHFDEIERTTRLGLAYGIFVCGAPAERIVTAAPGAFPWRDRSGGIDG